MPSELQLTKRIHGSSTALQEHTLKHLLADRRLLNECAHWQAMPHNPASLIALGLASKAVQERSDAEITDLSQAWKARHQVVGCAGQAQVPENPGAHAPVSACCLYNFCICSRGGRLVDQCWKQTKRILKDWYRDQESATSLVNGNICLLFSGRHAQTEQVLLLVILARSHVTVASEHTDRERRSSGNHISSPQGRPRATRPNLSPHYHLRRQLTLAPCLGNNAREQSGLTIRATHQACAH